MWRGPTILEKAILCASALRPSSSVVSESVILHTIFILSCKDDSFCSSSCTYVLLITLKCLFKYFILLIVQHAELWILCLCVVLHGLSTSSGSCANYCCRLFQMNCKDLCVSWFLPSWQDFWHFKLLWRKSWWFTSQSTWVMTVLLEPWNLKQLSQHALPRRSISCVMLKCHLFFISHNVKEWYMWTY